ncbi:MAG TPA: DNA ligase D [Bacteriovoracaceae bacterium]|nr:DNA ligase D [Bacteriovoracaceae bacterium]
MSDLLKDYNRKRDFTKTKEPSGKAQKKKGTKLIFVVQEHHASRLHYDFRLELDGVLKSWAVPKGPSLDPADKRLAVQTEDHPIEYAKFKGSIPKGEYGGGEIFIWDSGTWESVDEDPRAALEKGRLEFEVKGKKLHGKFILVRTHFKGGEDKKNWLLIKRHEDSEKAPVSKKVGTKKSTVKKKADELGLDKWPGFIAPQLPRLVTAVPNEDQVWIHEMKYDGYRMQAQVKDSLARYYTRNSLDWSNTFPHLINALNELPVTSAIFDGEVVALDEEGRSNFQKLQNSIKSKNVEHLRYYVFDIMYLNGKDLREFPLLERKKILKAVLEDADPLLLYSDHFVEQGGEFFQASCKYNLEGIISKLADAPYTSGRNDFWVKTKCTSRQEFVIAGWTDPKGGRTGIGALLLGLFEDGELRYAGKVGTGFNQLSLREIKKTLTPLKSEESPFNKNSPRERGIHWVKPIKVCEVSFSNFTDEGILRTPVFQGMREDKPAEDIHMEKAKKITKKVSKKLPVKSVRTISSPDKVLFKAEKKTKKDVAEFYTAIAKVMLPYLADRPLSLVRCPNGSEGSCFFQKHIIGNVPDSFNTFLVKEEKGQGIYVTIDSLEGLIELVQINAFEIHAWNSHKDTYMKPDQIVMDFDPGPGVAWKTIVESGFELKELLEDLGLKSFVKLTGGKGLHVHIPIAPVYSWDQVKSFSQTLAMELVNRRPELYTANMAKKLRNKKIFVDYLRNGYGATAVVPYSLRARPTSAIALPLEWSELRKVKGPQDFTMDKARKKILNRKVDPWKGMLKLKQKIKILKEQKSLKK